MSKETRKFKIKDIDLLYFARVMGNQLQKDVPVFERFDTTLNAANVAKFQQEVAARNLELDQDARLQLELYTIVLNQNISLSERYFTQIRYFAEIAFSDNPDVMKVFGLSLYRKARKRNDQLVLFMKMIRETVQQYTQELQKAGAHASFLTAGDKAIQALEEAYQEQAQFKLKRQQLTVQRIKHLNRLWKFILRVEKVSQFVFIENPRRRSPYIPPKAKRKKLQDNKVIISARSRTWVLDREITQPTRYLIRNTGRVPLGFFLSNQIGMAAPEDILWIEPKEEFLFDAKPLEGEGKTFFEVVNTAMQGRGEFVLKVVE